MPQFVSFSKVKERFDITPQTAKNWALRNLIKYKVVHNKVRQTWFYDIDSIGEYIDQPEVIPPKETFNRIVLYARVSSKKQGEDLTRQVKLLESKYPDTELIKDIGSGLNYKRYGFTKLVERICRGQIDTIVVTYRDRLLRFGYELFETVCSEFNCKIVVIGKESISLDQTANESETNELQEDLLSIVNVFVARRNGKRAGYLKKERRLLLEKEKEEENKQKQ
jgi:predicted site-specific integrase-resolvase